MFLINPKVKFHLLLGKLERGCEEKCSTLPETNSLPLKIGGWNTILSYWVSAYFQGLWLLVSVKGQWGVPLTVYPWYLLCSLGILGDNLPINTHYIGLI